MSQKTHAVSFSNFFASQPNRHFLSLLGSPFNERT